MHAEKAVAPAPLGGLHQRRILLATLCPGGRQLLRQAVPLSRQLSSLLPQHCHLLRSIIRSGGRGGGLRGGLQLALQLRGPSLRLCRLRLRLSRTLLGRLDGTCLLLHLAPQLLRLHRGRLQHRASLLHLTLRLGQLGAERLLRCSQLRNLTVQLLYVLLLSGHLARRPRLQLRRRRMLLLQLALQGRQLVLPPAQLVLQVSRRLALGGSRRLGFRHLLLQQLCLRRQPRIVRLLCMQQLLLQRRHGGLQLRRGGGVGGRGGARSGCLRSLLQLSDALVADLGTGPIAAERW